MVAAWGLHERGLLLCGACMGAAPPRKVLGSRSLGNLKGWGSQQTLIITTVLEQHPRSHHKDYTSM